MFQVNQFINLIFVFKSSEHQSRADNNTSNEPGRELVLTLRRGAAGFGFTIADSVHGQKVKKVWGKNLQFLKER